MTDNELRDEAIAYLKATTITYPSWSSRKYDDVTKTNWWKALDALAKIGTQQPWPASPFGLVTRVNNSIGLGLNVTAMADLHDFIIDTTGDSGVLFQNNSAGSSLKRAQLFNIAATNAVAYGKHAVYGKAAYLTIEDVRATCSRFCASGFSMRYDGAIVRRFQIDGAPHALTYYETSTKPGDVLFEDGRCTFTGDTAVWIDVEADYTTKVVQAFTFRRVEMTGPGNFLKASRAFAGSVVAEGCTLNGKPVTYSDFTGVSNLKIS